VGGGGGSKTKSGGIKSSQEPREYPKPEVRSQRFCEGPTGLYAVPPLPPEVPVPQSQGRSGGAIAVIAWLI
jgi:hypothetical protein